MVVTSQQMKEIERAATNYGATYLQMMENAGSQAAACIIEILKDVEDLNCAVFCGKGNNGGDGLVVARKMAEAGARVAVILTDGEPKTPEAQIMYHLADDMGLTFLDIEQDGQIVMECMEQVDIIVDAMYGSGFHGRLDSRHTQAALIVNSAIAAVFALDIPSGINCDTGEASEDAVAADFTIVFDSLKPAHLLPKQLPNLGRVLLRDIGIAPQAREAVEQQFFTPNEEYVFPLIPQKAVDSHKTTTGKLVNFAGSMGMAGAAVLSARGALRSGAGYVVTVAPKEIYPILASQLIQSTFKFLNEDLDVRPILGGASAVAIGCGLGQGETQRTILKNVLSNAKCPVIIDADGINNLSRDITILKEHQSPVILTPHMGEMASLCKCKAADVAKAPLVYAQNFAREHQAVVVLKGPNTVIASPEGAVAVNQTGNPGLAKAGSGDVLTGILSSLISQGMEPFAGAVCAVYLHGLAADRCAQRLSQYYMQPEDILEDLGQIFKEQLR